MTIYVNSYESALACVICNYFVTANDINVRYRVSDSRGSLRDRCC